MSYISQIPRFGLSLTYFGMMNVIFLDTFEQLEPLAADWQRLAGPHPFRGWSWAAAWWQAFGGGKRLAVRVVRDEAGAVVGIAPFYEVQSASQGRVLRLLGDDLACGDNLSLLIDPAHTEEVIAALASSLITDRDAGRWDQILLEGVTACDVNIRALTDALQAQGSRCDKFADQSRWSVTLGTSYDEWTNRLGDSTKRKARTFPNKRCDPKNSWTVRQPKSLEECRELYQQVVRLHDLRWQGAEHGGSFAKPGFGEFLSAAVERWFADGVLHLVVLEQGGVPAAGAINTIAGDKLKVYLLGRDPQFDRLQAGWMLSFTLIENAFAAGCTEVDFLRGDEPYKQHLRAEPIPQVRIKITGRGLVNQVRALATGGRYLARWVKRRVWRQTR